MTELPFDDERVQTSFQLLMRQMQRFIGEPLNSRTVSVILTMIDDHRTNFRREYGHDFPQLVPFILPSSQFIAWFRADLDDHEIYQKVLNLLHEFTVTKVPVNEVELATAIKMAWPSYQPPIEDFRRKSFLH
jgi:hypothetical protein